MKSTMRNEIGTLRDKKITLMGHEKSSRRRESVYCGIWHKGLAASGDLVKRMLSCRTLSGPTCKLGSNLTSNGKRVVLKLGANPGERKIFRINELLPLNLLELKQFGNETSNLVLFFVPERMCRNWLVTLGLAAVQAVDCQNYNKH